MSNITYGTFDKCYLSHHSCTQRSFELFLNVISDTGETVVGENFRMIVAFKNRRIRRRKGKKIMNLFAFVFLNIVHVVVCSRIGVLDQGVEHYTNNWKIHVSGGLEKVQEIAEKEGFLIDRQIDGLPGTYVLKHPKFPRSGNYAAEHLTKKLTDYDEVLWAEQSSALSHKSRINVNVNRFTCPRSEKGKAASNFGDYFTDPYWPAQWTMHDCRTKSADGPQYDINVMRVWTQYKIFGQGIIIIIIDDGLETTHLDLKSNYDPHFGLDLIDGDNTPDPVHSHGRIYAHGTRCAGVIAMQANNLVCGVGITPLATLGAVRLLGPKKSSDEADGTALLFRHKDVHIISNSWGPNDNGAVMAHLGKITEAAMKTAIVQGRGGKGVLYVFAAGNGKEQKDTCSCDPFVSSTFTIPVASADMNGKVTNYSERCASIFVTTYSGDGTSIYNVVATDVGRDRCTFGHTGTSASAPQVAAAVGMAIEANPNLTARDVQHLFPYTCEVAPLQDNLGTWVRSVTGLYYSSDFGFGLLDAFKLVTMAKTFKSVPPLSMCVVHVKLTSNEPVTRLKGYKKEIVTTGCKGLPSEVNYLEHVQLLTTIRYTKRGDLQIVLKSAAGTSMKLLEPRPNDANRFGIRNWAFDTLHSWGEPCAGTWEVMIYDKTGSFNNKGQVEQLTIIFHGTKDMPEHYKQRRTYFEFKFPKDNKS